MSIGMNVLFLFPVTTCLYVVCNLFGDVNMYIVSSDVNMYIVMLMCTMMCMML